MFATWALEKETANGINKPSPTKNMHKNKTQRNHVDQNNVIIPDITIISPPESKRIKPQSLQKTQQRANNNSKPNEGCNGK